ncbi:MAG: hypothetical protein JSW33_08095 [bacterium]|nr:MAG: hypothetical protein JSW33_08095 [bacterium]
MENFSKLKWTPGWYVPLIIFLFLFAIAFEASLTGTLGIIAWAFGAFFIFWGFIDYYRTRLVTYLIIGLLFGTGTWHALLAFNRVGPFSLITYLVQLVAVIFFFIFTGPILRHSLRLNRNARQIFRLAADGVHDKSEGFTPRPFNVGKLETSPDELEGFGRFLNGKQIIQLFSQKDKTFLAFSMGISPLSNPDLQKVSYVSFSKDQSMAVHVSGYDYHRYREELTFDQICEALANLFMRFLHYYQEGKESRILVELSS